MDDAASCGHPLNISFRNRPLVSHAVAVLDIAVQDIGDRFNATVRVPGEAFQIMLGIIGTKIVQQKKGIEQWDMTVAEGALQVNARTFNYRFAFKDLMDFSGDFHGMDFLFYK